MPAETESLDPRVARTLDSLHVGQRFGRLRVLSLDPEFVTTGVTGRSVSSLIREAVGRFLDAEGR